MRASGDVDVKRLPLPRLTPAGPARRRHGRPPNWVACCRPPVQRSAPSDGQAADPLLPHPVRWCSSSCCQCCLPPAEAAARQARARMQLTCLPACSAGAVPSPSSWRWRPRALSSMWWPWVRAAARNPAAGWSSGGLGGPWPSPMQLVPAVPAFLTPFLEHQSTTPLDRVRFDEDRPREVSVCAVPAVSRAARGAGQLGRHWGAAAWGHPARAWKPVLLERSSWNPPCSYRSFVDADGLDLSQVWPSCAANRGPALSAAHASHACLCGTCEPSQASGRVAHCRRRPALALCEARQGIPPSAACAAVQHSHAAHRAPLRAAGRQRGGRRAHRHAGGRCGGHQAQVRLRGAPSSCRLRAAG